MQNREKRYALEVALNSRTGSVFGTRKFLFQSFRGPSGMRGQGKGLREEKFATLDTPEIQHATRTAMLDGGQHP